jgi:hypothetical protein
MKYQIIRFLILVIISFSGILAFSCPTHALAGLFQNLDFEEGNFAPPTSGFLVPASDALPYWTCNNYVSGYVLYDVMTLDSCSISIHDGHGIDIGYPRDFNPLQGRYSIMLQDGVGPPNGQPFDLTNAYISQTGDIPSDARSIIFCSDYSYTLDRFAVSLNGTTIPMQLYSVGNTVNPNYGPITTFIGDISAFTGTNDVELRFTKLVQDPFNPYHGAINLDDIQFSSIVVPEPSSLALLFIIILCISAIFIHRRQVTEI